MHDVDSNASGEQDASEERGREDGEESSEDADADVQIEEQGPEDEDEDVTMGLIAKTKVSDVLKRGKKLTMKKLPFIVSVILMKNKLLPKVDLVDE